MRTGPIGSGVIAAFAAVLAGCTAPMPPAGEPSTSRTEQPPLTARPGELVGAGLVRQENNELPELCMGIGNDSYPPGCIGPPIHGWDWSQADGEEKAANVTWGNYVVYGTWNGTSLTVTRQPPRHIAPDEPWGKPDPRLDPHKPGRGTKARLQQIERQLWNSNQREWTDTFVDNGYVFLNVSYDDGSLQKAMNSRFGPGLVAVRSRLTPAD
jgi:hypothetical protein